jgi:hypothetical protein
MRKLSGCILFKALDQLNGKSFADLLAKIPHDQNNFAPS